MGEPNFDPFFNSQITKCLQIIKILKENIPFSHIFLIGMYDWKFGFRTSIIFLLLSPSKYT